MTYVRPTSEQLTIALKRVSGLLSRAQRFAVEPDLTMLFLALGTPEEDLEAEMTVADKRVKIAKYRVSGTMSGDYDDMSLEQAAEVLGIPAKSVRGEIGSKGSSSRRRRFAGTGDMETLTVRPVYIKKAVESDRDAPRLDGRASSESSKNSPGRSSANRSGG